MNPIDSAWLVLKTSVCEDCGHKSLYDCAECRAYKEKHRRPDDEWGMDPDAKVTRCVECNAPQTIYHGGGHEIEDDWICDDCLTEMGYEP